MRRTDIPGGAERSTETSEDRGTVLVMVLVMMVIGSLIVLPLLSYTMTVFRAGGVQTNKSEAVELARGGTWVALREQGDLWDKCDGSQNLSGSLVGVTTTCSVIDSNKLRPVAEIPYHVVTVAADEVVPAYVSSYTESPPIPPVETTNPNSTSPNPDDWDKWIDDALWSPDSTQNTIWLPHLPVRTTTNGGSGSFIDYPAPTPDCRTFFPGTYTAPITISGPAYFTSGIYYFTDTITLQRGAHVVVGNGIAGCADDQQAVFNSDSVPNPLNISGVGGTFVLGDDARLVIDDSVGSGPITFIMNQRYVSAEETSVAASANISILSVNGAHEPLLPSETLGDPLVIDGVIHVPASEVDSGEVTTEAAVGAGYTPSSLTYKPTVPDAPTILSAEPLSKQGPGQDGRLTVTWSAPNDNGSLITGYTVYDAVSGESCSPATPVAPDWGVQLSCMITNIGDETYPEVTVVATNAMGTSDPSPTVFPDKVNYRDGGGPYVPLLEYPDAPQNVSVSAVYNDGFEISWDPPADDGGAPILGYEVVATTPGFPDALCSTWWDATSCVLAAADIQDGLPYEISVVAIETENPWHSSQGGSQPPKNVATIGPLPLIVNPVAPPTPPPPPAPVATPRVPTPILDLTTESAADVDIVINGYVSVPQGRIEISATHGSEDTDVQLIGGVLAGELDIEPATQPAKTKVLLHNPISQKRVKITTTLQNADYYATSVAVAQVNKSGSLAVNSWFVQ